MMSKLGFAISILVFLFTLSPAARACTGLSLNLDPLATEWKANAAPIKLQFEVRRTAPFTACSYFITFSKGMGPSADDRQARSGAYSLPYQIYSNPTPNSAYILKDLETTNSSSHFIFGSFDSSPTTTRKHEVYVHFPFAMSADPFLPHYGSYVDSIVAKLFTGQPGQAGQNATNVATLPVTIGVGRAVKLSIGTPGAAFQKGRSFEKLDFGILKKGMTKTVDLRVVTNAGYVVRASSLHDGVMAHSKPQVQTSVPYTVRVNSAPVELRGSKGRPVVVAQGGGTSRLSGFRNEVQVTIGDVDNKMAGEYRDVLTFEVRAIE